MSKHTEGPWNVERIGNHIEIWKQDGSNHISVAWVHIGDDHTTGELNACLADAHLIAAAPDMLEALKALNDLFDGDGFRIDLAANLPQLLSKADAAISKAEGRTAVKEQSSL